MAHSKTSQATVQGALRRKDILELRLRGLSTPQIAEQLGCGATTVKRQLRKALDALAAETQEMAAYERDVDLARIDRLLPRLIEGAESGDLDAANTLEKLFRRRAAMLGYDMPTKIERTDEPPPPLAIYVAGPGGELLPLDDFQQALNPGGDDAGDQ